MVVVKSVRVKLNPKGVAALLKSQGVQADVERRTNRIAAAAGGEPDFEARTQVGPAWPLNRPIGFVTTATAAGRRAEAENRALTRAIDAGR
jgi:hypothetical protein